MSEIDRLRKALEEIAYGAGSGTAATRHWTQEAARAALEQKGVDLG